MKLVVVQGELAIGMQPFVGVTDNEYPMYGVGEVCRWLWEHPGEPCCLVLTSAGGDQGAAYALIAAMQAHGEAHTYAVGYIASAALDVLYSGKTRGIHPDTLVMTHRGTRESNKRVTDLYVARDRRLYRLTRNIIDQWHLIFPARARYWTAQEIVTQGFADYVALSPQ